MWKTASIITGVVLVLLTLGIVMLASTSGVLGEVRFKDPLFFVKRQAVWLVMALVAGAVVARLPYRFWKRAAVPLLLFSIALLVAVLVVGKEVKGSTRWIGLGPVNFQPSELAKLGALVFLAWWMSEHRRFADTFWRGFAIPIGFLGLVCALIIVEPDFGTTALIAVSGAALMFVGGTRISYLLVTGIGGAVLFAVAIMHSPVRLRRIMAFRNPEAYAQDEAFQLLNAIYAFVMGGARGTGLGEGLQKRFYLPEAHTDFIFAIIGEELGVGASLGVLALFAAFFVCGMTVSFRAKDAFGRLLAFGITFLITAQAAFNMGVVTGSLPTKGLPLPFISFGGSSLLMTVCMVGVLLSIALGAAPADGQDQDWGDPPAR